MAIQKLYYSCKKGCRKIPQELYMQFQDELFVLLGCATKQHYYQRRACMPNLAWHIKLEIDKLFEKYGIAEHDDIWDITDAKPIKE